MTDKLTLDVTTIKEATWATEEELNLIQRFIGIPRPDDEIRFSAGEIILHEGIYYAFRGLYPHTRELLFTSKKEIVATIIAYGNVISHRTVCFSTI
jgi:hypothetical protein